MFNGITHKLGIGRSKSSDTQAHPKDGFRQILGEFVRKDIAPFA
ncbi:hypothetical protein AVHY2522_06995 [Acidovorax sp. SUPP2522]|nr:MULTISPECIES: hypothetical protein [unclassified Acidovorax]GKT15099.1 hypothetical protein AVHY2522_06995 [Acidovorax sp. SUPP2522]